MKEAPISAAQSVLQEFWSLLYDAAHSPDALARDVSLLRAWGVFHFALHGPTECKLCRTPVRLAIPITSTRGSGESTCYACLCTNCAFAELERSQRIVLQVGRTRVEYTRDGVEGVPATFAAAASAQSRR
jgi:hypothetical protein